MMFKISFSTLGCPDWDWSEVLAAAKDLSYDGIEVRGIGGQLYLPKAKAFRKPNLDSTLNSLKRTGLSISCLASSCYLHLTDNRDERLKEVLEYIELAEQLGAPYIRVLGDTDPEPKAGPEVLPLVKDALKQLAPLAADHGVKLLIETNGYFAKSKRIAELVDSIGENGLGVLWDINHPYRFFGESIGETWSVLKQYVDYIHFKDSVVRDKAIKYTLIGQGDLPVSDTVKLLLEQDYNGWISLEWVKRWNPDMEEPTIALPHFIDYIKRYTATK